jgi:UrcA family protein
MKHVKMISTCAALAVAGAAFAIGSPAYGKTHTIVVIAPADIVSRHVSYADLNLASASAQHVLRSRVSYAIGDLCRQTTGYIGPTFGFESAAVNQCSEAAWGQARPQIAGAVLRSREMASTGQATVAAAAITISIAP